MVCHGRIENGAMRVRLDVRLELSGWKGDQDIKADRRESEASFVRKTKKERWAETSTGEGTQAGHEDLHINPRRHGRKVVVWQRRHFGVKDRSA